MLQVVDPGLNSLSAMTLWVLLWQVTNSHCQTNITCPEDNLIRILCTEKCCRKIISSMSNASVSGATVEVF